jgi:hypothetical protein
VFRRPALSLRLAHMLGAAVPFPLFPSQLFNHRLVVSAALVLQRRWQ